MTNNYMHLFYLTGDLKLRFNPQPENGRYTFSQGETISIACIVFCPCGGTRADWNEPETLPEGLEVVPLVSSRRSVALRTRSGVGAQPEHSGFYTCRVFNSEESIMEEIEIVVT